MSYAHVTGHQSMVFDEARNRAYARAIAQCVTPDSVVLDLGCGLGIHGLLAAKAGARKVFLVDPEIVVQSALEVARFNGFGDRVQAFQGRIEEIELPEKVDVIISVFTGNLLYSEDLLPSLYFARDRWLKPGGHLIPDAAELLMAPVCAPKRHAEWIAAWSTPHLEIDYSPIRRYAANQTYWGSRDEYANWTFLAEPATVERADFHEATTTGVDCTTDFAIRSSADCTGMLGWIRIHLGDDWVGTGPKDPPMHWTPQLLPLDPEWALKAGDTMGFKVHRPAWGEWTWTCTHAGQQQRHSTFLSQPVRASDLRALMAGHKPGRNAKGELLLHTLSRLDGDQTKEAIAAGLLRDFPRRFANEREALVFVESIVRTHGA